MNKSRRIIILTGVSCSGKTTLQKEMINKGWKKPINFTTRSPRTKEAREQLSNEDWIGEDFISEELNEYVFLNDKAFIKKYINGDFLEISNYGGDRYGASNILPEQANVIIILDPIGRSQALAYFTKLGIGIETYYLEINKEEQIKRLKYRGDSEEEIKKRKQDFNWFSQTNKCVRLNGNKPVEELIKIIENNG